MILTRPEEQLAKLFEDRLVELGPWQAQRVVEGILGREDMKLYEYAILYHPHQTKDQKDKGVAAKSILVADVTRVLARDEKEVTIQAARAIPEEYLDKLDRVEVAVRPF